jgi:hypothetical protein
MGPGILEKSGISPTLFSGLENPCIVEFLMGRLGH